MRRYFNTKDVTPLAVMYLATSVPCSVMTSAIKPPPGHITTAVPFLNSGEGLKTIRLGLVTLATTSVFPTFLRRARRSAGVEERETSYVASSHYA